MSSTHKVEVVKVEAIEKHPKADKLGIVRVWGYQVVVALADWKVGDLAAYVPPDSLVPLWLPEFEWLRTTGRSPKVVDGREYHLVRSIRLRGEVSFGLLVKAPENSTLGEDLASLLGVLHYDPPDTSGSHLKFTKKGGNYAAEPAPFCKPPLYDVDALKRYPEAFAEGEEVWVTEKIHGANARYVWEDRGFFQFLRGGGIRIGDYAISLRGIKKLPSFVRYLRVGSRNLWKRWDANWSTQASVNDVWWQAILQEPKLQAFLKANPGTQAYGEVYGKVQDLHYGVPDGVRLALFDLRTPQGTWLDVPDFKKACKENGLPMVPEVGVVPYSFGEMLKLAEGSSLLEPSQVREGVVVKSMEERVLPGVGRLCLKMVGEGYYGRKA